MSLALSTITIYCVYDDLLRAMRPRADRQCRHSCAEIMMLPLLAALCFGGNGVLFRNCLVGSGVWKHSLSRSRFSRRLHQVPREAWALLQEVLGSEFCEEYVNPNPIYIVDSIPVDAFASVRAVRSRLFPQRTSSRLFFRLSLAEIRWQLGSKNVIHV